ncbi:very short patch repair endonuclease [Inquilinus limosus]|uniref:very short patch repair endonuclease n=1 Tax=Inquilinus limosus TaxID=171674 RepID=UPI0004267F2D|nr:DNA mismatch endonuclease Vsr [Inquilinus limosus]
MADRLTPEERSRLMARIKGKDTTPERRARRAAHALGLRFRLHRRDLPGTPDMVLPKRRVALFVHGCFWHQHAGCRKARRPLTRPDYWAEKFRANAERDARAAAALAAAGWRVVVLWECETEDSGELRRLIGERVCRLPFPPDPAHPAAWS